MNAFLSLTTRTKLVFGFGLILLLLLAVMATAYQGITTIQTAQERLYNRDFADTANLLEIRTKNNRVRADILNMMLLSKRSDQEVWHKDLKESSRDIDNQFQQLFKRQRENREFLNKLEELKAINDAYVQTRDEQQIPLIYSGKISDALDIGVTIQSELYLKMRDLAKELGDSAQRNAQAAVEESKRKAGEILHIFIIIGAVALMLSMVLVVLLTRIIADPIKAVAEAAGRIAMGVLTDKITLTQRTDEMGKLAQSFRDMVEGLRKLTLDIRDSINILTTSASEILATTSQVASGSAETATAVSETTSTVEEVKQTVQLAGQKSKQVMESALKTVQTSEAGQHAVAEMISGMERIREQTAATAVSIVKLNEQSQEIGEIIITVNDLAEQSNLLAVNAAIEAAKAGEQGKGFAVVAQEIKSLAEQSKQATAQVRVILGEIQKATTAAVIATDLNGKAVEAGVQQSDAAGESIKLLADSILAAAQAAQQITASSQQQIVGMDQVALAMENIKQASAQNMAGTRQAEQAAQNLHELGLKLKQLVERYKI